MADASLFHDGRVVAFERPVDRVAEWKSWHADPQKVPPIRAARAFTDTPTPAFLCASVPCLSHCQAQLRIVRRVRAMP